MVYLGCRDYLVSSTVTGPRATQATLAQNRRGLLVNAAIRAQLALQASSDPLVTQALQAHLVLLAPPDRREGLGLPALQTQGQAALRELIP